MSRIIREGKDTTFSMIRPPTVSGLDYEMVNPSCIIDGLIYLI